MERSFHKTYSPVMKVIAAGGLHFPGSEVIYPRFALIVRIITYILFVGSITNLVMEAVNQFLFMASSRAEGMTDLYLVMAFGIASPTYIFVAYGNMRGRAMSRIVDIWENDMTNPPYPEDRKAEIVKAQSYFSRVTKAEVSGFIIPFTVSAGRTILTNEPPLPIAYTGDLAVSPANEIVSFFFAYFGYSLATAWCASENTKLLFMKSILAELNHLHLAADKILTVNEETKPFKSDKELKAVRENLRSWIIHHQTVLRFSDEVNSFIGPMILIQDLVNVTFQFANIFLLVTGRVPFFYALPGIGYFVFHWYVLYVSFSLGDEIRLKSENIFETFNGKEYYWFPKDIVMDVIYIQFIATHRPITLKATWYKSLSRKSMGELASKGYEMITFLSHLIRN